MRFLSFLLAALAVSSLVHAASIDPQLQKSVRAATFEVVLKKSATDPLTYDKPLPLELLPYVQRTDPYWSLGTAFAIGENTFVSAGHVMVLGVGSQFGEPVLRDASGGIHAVDRVLQYSSAEDFMVFTVKSPPKFQPLQVSREARIDDPIFAVGNALGEGVIIRDGLFTSETPEPQDGRWKMMRFSAAASPGNSGGPLLDAAGRVVGVVLAKSPNENLNYALPIGRVIDGSAREATFYSRAAFGLPFLRDRTTVRMQTEFALPKSYAQFAAEYQRILQDTNRQWIDQLLREKAAELWPKGQSDKAFAQLVNEDFPTLLAQDADGVWTASKPESIDTTQLGGEGSIRSGYLSGQGLFRLVRADHGADAALYSDSQQMMDLLLKGFKFPREVGSDQVLITSLGKARGDRQFKDRFGRVWQSRSWPLGYNDLWVICASLPTPDGYAGMITFAAGVTLQIQLDTQVMMADYFNAPYDGTDAQWQAYLQRRPLRAALFDGISLQYDRKSGLRFGSQRFAIDVPATVMPLTDRTELLLDMTFMAGGTGLTWDVGRLLLRPDRDGKSYVTVLRQARPGAAAGKDAETRWRQMRERSGEYAERPNPSNNRDVFWTTSIVDPPRAADAAANAEPQMEYLLYFGTDRRLLPRELYDLQAAALRGMKVLER